MAKFPISLFLVLAAFLYVEGITIGFPMASNDGRNTNPDTMPDVTLNDPSCKGRNGLFPNPANCKAYYACRGGTSQDRLCPEGMAFHPQSRHCTFEANPSCLMKGTGEEPVESPSCKERNGLFPNPDNCKAFYACRDGTRQDRFCPEGMTFHPQNHCTFEENPSCFKKGAGEDRVASRFFAEVSCPSYYGMFKHPQNCHKYIVCSGGIPDVRTCPDDFWYQENIGCMEADTCLQ